MLDIDLNGKRVNVLILDEAKLPFIDRLGLAYCRLNNYEWDSLLGPKPDGFDGLPNYCHTKRPLFEKLDKSCHTIRSKHDIIEPLLKMIASIIGEANISRCQWIFELDSTEEEWLQWYIREHSPWWHPLRKKPFDPVNQLPKRFGK